MKFLNWIMALLLCTSLCTTVERSVASEARSTANSVLIITPQDLTDIVRVVGTEVSPHLRDESYIPQLRAVTDTILNRWASGHWGNLRHALNAPYQFSAINSNLPGAWGAVENIPESRISPRVSAAVRDWLSLRASGHASIVGNNLNYLNIYFSSSHALTTWGYELATDAERKGLVFGAGRAKHWHGTTKDLVPYRPGAFQVQMPN